MPHSTYVMAGKACLVPDQIARFRPAPVLSCYRFERGCWAAMAASIRAIKAGRRAALRSTACRARAGNSFATAVCRRIHTAPKRRHHGSPHDIRKLLLNAAQHFFQTRANLYRACGETTADFIALTRKRFDAEMRTGRFVRRWLAIIAAFCLPWSVWMYVAHASIYRAEPWRALVGFGSAGLILAALTVYTSRKARKLARDRASFEVEVDDSSDDMGWKRE